MSAAPNAAHERAERHEDRHPTDSCALHAWQEECAVAAAAAPSATPHAQLAVARARADIDDESVMR